MGMIASSFPHLAVKYGDPVPCFGPVRRAFLLTGQCPLGPGQAALPRPQESRISDNLAV